MPPANIANPWFGSDVAATMYRATLRLAVDQTAEQADGPCCVAMVPTKHNERIITATATAAALEEHLDTNLFVRKLQSSILNGSHCR
jgi:hypothetical protein